MQLDELTCLGHPLDRQPHTFGWLQSAAGLLNQPAALQQRMQTDGYLFLPGLLDAQLVWQVRQEICDRLATEGALAPTAPPLDAIAQPDTAMHFRPDLVFASPTLLKLLYTGAMMDFYQKFLGGPVRHFDYTWFRAVPPGHGTYPHCDIVYMGRGTFNLFTAWTPIGDVPLTLGGLMILEGSHRQREKFRAYLTRDVDEYCTSYPNAAAIESGEKTWQDWDGRLSSNPVSLREKVGGRWLTTEYQAGDVLCFGMATVHASLDNHSREFRLSSDCRYQLASEPCDERWVGANPIGHGAAGKKGVAC
jgi:hypothetical protein